MLVPVPLDLYPNTSRQKGAAAIIFISSALALLVVGLRVYSRLRKQQYGLDDSLVCIAMIISLGESVSTYFGMRTMFQGVPESEIPKNITTTYGLLWIWISQVLYNPILALVKSSVLIFLLRLGAGLRPNVRLAIQAVNVFNILQAIGTFAATVFQCTPVSYYWLASDSREQPGPGMRGSCIHQGDFYVITAGLTVFTDVLVLALPIWIFGGLKMKLKMRLALIAVFCLSGCVLVISILRLRWNYNLNFGDPTTDDIGVIYSPVESNLAIIASCGPALRPLIAKWFVPSLAETPAGCGSGHHYRQDPHGKENIMDSTRRRKQRILTSKGYRLDEAPSSPPSPSSPRTSFRGHSFTLKDMRTTTTTEVEAGHRTPRGNPEDGIVPQGGIMMTREYVVQSDAESVRELTKKEELEFV